MWERKETHAGNTIWQGRDPEGRRIYAVTGQWNDGTATEPSGSTTFYSLRIARTEAKWLAQAE